VLAGFRAFLRWRKNHLPLQCGDIRFIDAHEAILMFTRSHQDETIIVAFNLSQQPLTAKLPRAYRLSRFDVPGLVNGRIDGQSMDLPGYGAVFASVA
jgi:alpha-glucosidase